MKASDLTTPGLVGALSRYRVMAWLVGAMLLFLCVVAIPLQFGDNRPAVANTGFTIHGILYIVYLLSVADLGRRAHFRLSQVIALVCAGFLPGLAFYIEHRTTRRLVADYRRRMEATAALDFAAADKRAAGPPSPE